MEDIVAIILATLYVLLLLLITLQIIMIIGSNDKIVTIRNAILIILCLSCLFRSILWIAISATINITLALSTTIMLILYFIPIWLNVFGISLLTVFYFETWISAAKSSKPIKLMLTPIQICLTLNFIFFIIAVSIITVISQKSDYSTVMTSVYEGYAAFLDISLALSLCILGYNFYIDFSHKATKVLLPTKITTFYIINCLVTLTYFVRGIFSLIIALQVQLPFSVSVDFSEYHDPTTSTALVFYLFLEWFPISCIVFLLWRRIYFKSNQNETIEKLLHSSTSVDDENQISINYNEALSDAEAVSFVYGSSSYISSYNLVGTDNDEYDSVIYPTNDDNAAHSNEHDDNIIDNSPVSERSIQTRGSRTTYVGHTPPPKHFSSFTSVNTSAPKPAALDFIFRSSPFAITSSVSCESSPSLQISPASNSSLSAYDSLLSKYQPPKLGQSTLSHLHVGAPFVNERDTSKILNSYTSRDSLNSNTDQDF